MTDKAKVAAERLHKYTEARLMEHIMTQGAEEKSDNSTAKGRLQQKVKDKQEVKENNKSNNQKNNKKNLNIEKTLRSVLGDEYKPQKKKRKRGKKKGKNNKKSPQKNEPIKVKTSEERMYKTAKITNGVLTISTNNITVEGTLQATGFHIPELDLAFEASDLRARRKYVFVSNLNKKNLYGLTFQHDTCEILACMESHADRIEGLLEGWKGLTVEETADIENKQDEREAEEEEAEEEGPELLTFQNHCYEQLVDDLYGGSFQSGDDMAWVVSQSEDSSDTAAVTYIPSATPGFIKKNGLLNSSVVLLNCDNLFDTLDNPQGLSWKQVQPFIESSPKISFILNNFAAKPKEVFDFFGNLVKESEIDLSNVYLFLPAN